MYRSFEYIKQELNDEDNSLLTTITIFKALVNAIIPRTPGLAELYGKVQYYGALDLTIEEYIMLTLDHMNNQIPLGKSTAEMLDAAAYQYELLYGSNNMISSRLPGQGFYAAFSPMQQLQVLALLRQLQLNLENLPVPFYHNPEFVISIINTLISFTMIGYYSEWAGYGTTRLLPPEERILEYYPISWKQIGYPGPSLGYHALRAYSFTS